jgi:two-component system, chemotaxis family, protein-glutamate methylesterase/glutaminase
VVAEDHKWGQRMQLPTDSSLHDVIAIGGSAGSFAALKTILRSLPADLPAAVIIVTHLGPSVSLINILGNSSSLPVSAAVSGEPVERGHVYLAVPDAHLMVHDHHLLVRRGPRENFSRPAVDPLFRSVACAFGGRAIGVLLSGGLNDGSSGLAAIKACGGIVIVQDPSDAEVPSMPESALRAVDADHCVPAAEVASLLAKLVQHSPGSTPPMASALQLEVAIAAHEAASMEIDEKLGRKSPFSCPDCDGVLWQIDDDRLLRFRCHVGHAVTAEALLDAKAGSVDSTLWRLLRVHEERAALARKMATQALAARQEALALSLKVRAEGYEEDASLVRELLSVTVE